jgi:hypothetical protein
VKCPFQKALFGFRDVNPSKRSLGQSVGRNQCQTVHTHLVDAVDGLEGKDPNEHMQAAQGRDKLEEETLGENAGPEPRSKTDLQNL